MANLRWLIAASVICGMSVAPGARADTAQDWTLCRGTDDVAAIKACTALIDLAGLQSSELAQAYANRGVSHDNTGDFDFAIADYNKAIDLNPKYAFAYNGRGSAYADKGAYDSAIEDYNSAIFYNPKYTNAYHNRGLTYHKKGDNDLALGDYSRAIELDSKYAPPYNDRGVVHDEKGDYDLAIADYDLALSLDPKFSYSYNNRGYAYMMRNRDGDNDLAISDYNTAIKLDAKFAQPYANRGIALWGQGDDQRAMADLTHALELNPNLAFARSKLDLYRKDMAAHAARATVAVVPGRRVALVIGIGDYDQLPGLPNAEGDAKAVADALTHQGYQVTLVPKEALKDAIALQARIDDFANNIVPGAETALIWYTGHGQAVPVPAGSGDDAATRPEDFLLPGDFKPGDNILTKGIDVEQLTWAVARAGNLAIVFIDACRKQSGPSEGFVTLGDRKPKSGNVDLRTDNQVVVYSAQPGKTASDGIAGQHSPFAQAFLEGIKEGAAKRSIADFTLGIEQHTRTLSGQSGSEQEPFIVNHIQSWKVPSLAGN